MDDYYRAIDIYSKEAKPYILAVKTFLQFDKYEDAQNIIERAEQEEIASDQLVFYKSRILRSIAKSDEDIKKAYELVSELKEREHDLERKGDAWYAGALCKLDLNELNTAIEEIDKAIMIDESEGDYLYCKANILFKQRKYKEAQNLYEELKKQYPDSDTVMFKLGRVYDMQDDIDTALSYYLKVLDIYPEHDSVNHYIAEIYRVYGEAKYDTSYFEKALPYYSKQIEIYPIAFNYNARGFMYAKLERFEEALLDYKKAIEEDGENRYAYNNMGKVYKILQKYEPAIDCFLKSIEFRKDDSYIRAYINLAYCYLSIGDYEKAEYYYRENIKVFPDIEEAYTELATFYWMIKQYEKAIKTYEEAKSKLKVDVSEYLCNYGDIYAEQGDIRRAETFYKKALKCKPVSTDTYVSYAEFCFYTKVQYKKALRFYKKAMESCNNTGSYKHADCLYGMGMIYYYLGKKEKSKDTLEALLDYYIRTYGGLSQYINISNYRTSRNFEIGRIYYYLGHVKKAREYFEQMDCEVICLRCKYPKCYEALIAKGLLAESEGKAAEALNYYREADTVGNNIYCKFLMKQITKKMKYETV